MASLDTNSCTWSVSPGIGLASVGNVCMDSFRRWSATSASSVQWKLIFSMHPLSVWNNGIAFSADLEINRLNAVILPFQPWTSLKVCDISSH